MYGGRKMRKPAGYDLFHDSVYGYGDKRASPDELHELCKEHTAPGHNCDKCRYFLESFRETSDSFEMAWRFDFLHSREEVFNQEWGKLLSPFPHIAALQSDVILPETQLLIRRNIDEWEDGDADKDVLFAIAVNPITPLGVLEKLVDTYHIWLDLIICYHPNTTEQLRNTAREEFDLQGEFTKPLSTAVLGGYLS